MHCIISLQGIIIIIIIIIIYKKNNQKKRSNTVCTDRLGWRWRGSRPGSRAGSGSGRWRGCIRSLWRSTWRWRYRKCSPRSHGRRLRTAWSSCCLGTRLSRQGAIVVTISHRHPGRFIMPCSAGEVFVAVKFPSVGCLLLFCYSDGSNHD